MIEYVNDLPLFQFFLVASGLSLVFLLGGMATGSMSRKSHKDSNVSGLEVVGGAQLSIVALMIAFIFSIASSRFDARRANLLDHSNALGTTYLRTDLLQEPARSELKLLLKDYVNGVVEFSTDPGRRTQVIKELDTVLDSTWKSAARYAFANDQSKTTALFIETLNETIDLHAKRITVGIVQKIPESVWLTLYVLSLASVFVIGYITGLKGGKISIPVILLAFTVSSLITITSDLDRADEGLFRISQKPMIDLQQKINSEVK